MSLRFVFQRRCRGRRERLRRQRGNGRRSVHGSREMLNFERLAVSADRRIRVSRGSEQRSCAARTFATGGRALLRSRTKQIIFMCIYTYSRGYTMLILIPQIRFDFPIRDFDQRFRSVRLDPDQRFRSEIPTFIVVLCPIGFRSEILILRFNTIDFG